ncbi:DUF86 domain-containing protein [Roseofilum sp. BLCC_M91]|uniref:DUF86 domain-containing protein n=1 Tax=Roseofilum halophilum BLCC-M91 TaxID=3022259 RepID=A0ABT7BKX2_9CYAN|nr:DUF86 domain-containing protein [Roseofilum halophilum]MDJ1179821.1 DUF86 domain-containing protein [Roseofilum halophilum BLCC-M91]
MSRDIIDYLEDILENIDIAQEFLVDLSYAQFREDRRTIYAVTRALEIIGEATKSIPQSVRDQYPAVPWRSISGMRDKVVHEYFGVDTQVLWDTVQDDLPLLRPTINQMLQDRTR